MKAFIFFLLCFFGVRTNSNETCPDSVICTTSETIDSCPPGTYFSENVKVHGCCPGCVERLDATENCTTSDECKPGLVCSKANKCVQDPNGQWCAVTNLTPNKAFPPTCLPDGTYAPKQCKGEKKTGRCFCNDKKGKRIFGEEYWNKADNMTCACSRQVAKMKETRLDVTIHCDEWGNFEVLQCDQGVCWCADEYSGDPYSAVVPEKLMETLPCYSESKIGTQYLRQCDSQYINQERGRKLMYNHGSTNIYFAEIRCNPDGSFDRYQVIDNTKKCTYRDKTIITEGVGPESSIFESVDCNCAYDKYVASLNGQDFDKACDVAGNYVKTQMTAGQYYCVDSDGVALSQLSTDPNFCKSINF